MHRRHAVVGLALDAACFRGRCLWDHWGERLGGAMHKGVYFNWWFLWRRDFNRWDSSRSILSRARDTMSPLREIHSTAPAYPTGDLNLMAV